ncbi:26S proteasome regulatory subunit 4-like, partial [Diaphorina citri]|uniref:26S proteasome regulatory subunit 4-like n=1 Tax=Diaphorina citri TaxID=121845 RepID=A0A3Q0IXE5_DIACI
LDVQIQEIKESVELPLTHPEYYEEMGIKPPKGVILYGPPGTGKTLLAKAVANQTSATFLRVVGSELIQKYLGDGPKLVRDPLLTGCPLLPKYPSNLVLYPGSSQETQASTPNKIQHIIESVILKSIVSEISLKYRDVPWFWFWFLTGNTGEYT